MSNLRKRLFFSIEFLLLVVFALTLVSCQPAPAEEATSEEVPEAAPVEQVLIWNLGAEPPTLDPALATDTTSFDVINQLIEGLTTYDKNLNNVPAMAESWEVSDDGLVYTFHLRDAKWSNGDPVTAQDFEYAWKRALDPELGSEYAYQLYNLKNGAAYNAGEITDPDQIGVKALDDKTLQATLEKPAPYFLSLTAFMTLYPVHRASIEANPDTWTEAGNYVSNGPFILDTWEHENLIVLKPNPNYYDADKVKLEEIRFVMITEPSTAVAAFENGEVYYTQPIPPADIDRMKQDPGYHNVPYLGTYYYGFNTTKEPWNNAKVRQALASAIDRQAIVDNITKGDQQIALSFVPPGVSGYQEGIGWPYDPEKAKQLLAEAGYPDGEGFPEFSLLFNTEGAHQPIAEAVAQMWKENLGVTAKLEGMEWKAFLASRMEPTVDIMRLGWIGDYPDPNTFLELYTSWSGGNDVHYNNAEYDALVEKASTTLDPEERLKILQEAEKIIIEDAPIVPIYHYNNVYLLAPFVKGYDPNALNVVYLKEVSLEAH